MKHYFFLLLCVLSLSLTAQTTDKPAAESAASGMTFVEKPFAELLAMAKDEDKIIFIDAYTTWCGPCKMMAAKVFPRQDVGAVYNEKFINAKIDMEKGEGPEIAKRYGVMAYPTYLFVDGNGDIVHKGIGYIPEQAFLELADAATGDASLGVMNKRYDGGDRSAEFMSRYAQVLTDVYEQEKAGKVTDEYLATLDDWNNPTTLRLLASNPGDLGGKRMNYLMDNADAVMQEVGADEFIGTVQRQIITDYMTKKKVRKLPNDEEIAATYDEYGGKLAPRLKSHYKMMRAEMMGEQDAYVPAAIAYYDEYGGASAMALNSLAWGIFESSEDQALLKKALKMAKQSVEMDAGYANMDTLAWLYHKTGDKKMARETAKKAIEMAKETGEDYSDTARILEK